VALGGDLTEKQRLIVWGAIMGGLAVLLGVGLYMGRSKHTEITDKAKEKRKELKQYQDEVDQKIKVKAELDETREKTKPYIALLPSKTEADRLMRALGRVVMDTNIYLTRVSDAKKSANKPKPGYTMYEYSFDFEAGFHEMVSFFNQLEDHFPRFLQITDIGVKSEKNGLQPGAKHHQIDMKVVTYVYEEKM